MVRLRLGFRENAGSEDFVEFSIGHGSVPAFRQIEGTPGAAEDGLLHLDGSQPHQRLARFGDGDILASERPLDQAGELGLSFMDIDFHNPMLAKVIS